MDPSGATLLGLDPPAPMHAPTLAELSQALLRREPVLVDLHTGTADPEPHINLIVPISAEQDAVSTPLGALILTAPARRDLYPLLEEWPVPHSSGQLLLIRREGDEVLVLNPLPGGRSPP